MHAYVIVCMLCATNCSQRKKAADRGGGKNSVQVLHFISYLSAILFFSIEKQFEEKVFAEFVKMR